MRKIVASGLALVAGVVPLPPLRSPQRVTQQPASDRRQDPRAEALRNFFGRADCPAAQYANVFLEAADDYHLDWRLLPSISFIESTGGKAASNNNLFGWDEGRAEFPTPTAGIHTVGYSLTHSRPYRAKSLDEKLALYNPNAGYAKKVKSVMRSISPQE
jgi:hypothetical protein